MTGTILVASDLSVRSERALRRAADRAARLGMSLEVISVVDDDLPPGRVERRLAETREDLERLCAAVTEMPVTLHVQAGEPVPAIVAAVQARDPALLVLGTHRSRPFWDLFSGTTMERIVRAVTCPVLLVKDATDHDYARLLAGIDLSPACESALRQACRLAPGADIATFHAVHVPFRGFTAPQGTAEQVGPFVDAAQAELDAWWDATDLPEAVARPEAQAAGRGELLSFKLRALEPDLLVIGAHGRPAFAATMLGGFTEEILRDPPCDVLVVRR